MRAAVWCGVFFCGWLAFSCQQEPLCDATTCVAPKSCVGGRCVCEAGRVACADASSFRRIAYTAGLVTRLVGVARSAKKADARRNKTMKS